MLCQASAFQTPKTWSSIYPVNASFIKFMNIKHLVSTTLYSKKLHTMLYTREPSPFVWACQILVLFDGPYFLKWKDVLQVKQGNDLPNTGRSPVVPKLDQSLSSDSNQAQPQSIDLYLAQPALSLDYRQPGLEWVQKWLQDLFLQPGLQH